MDSNSWINCPSVFSSSSSSSSTRRHQSRSELYLGGGYEDFEGEDVLKAEYICPFCAEEFDIVGLCCHIDEEHPVEANNGVCPLCTKRVGSDIVGHITMQHKNLFKVQRRRRKFHRGGSNSAYLALKKELQEANSHSLLGESSCFSSSTNIDSDPLLSSFMFNSPSRNESKTGSAAPLIEPSSATKASSHMQTLERNFREVPLSGEDQEKARKSEFVSGLMLSTMFDYDF